MGRTLGRYRIDERVGAGGMGVVYRARDARLDRDVAIKVLPHDALGDEAARARFRREALALARLSHPNVGVVFDFATEDGIDFLVMEYVVGASLDAKIADGSVTTEDAIALGIQIASALGEAHEQRIIHRDLKPANVMVTAKGQAKVLDFGLARLLRPDGTGPQTTTHADAGVLAGTLPYMAPEQLGGQAADERTDIWAVGVVLHEMLSGSRPFQGKTAFSLSAAILSEPPHPLPPEVPRPLADVIARCLEKDPARRYQSASDLSTALRAMGPPAAARTARRPPALVVGVAVVAAAVLTGVLLSGRGGVGAPGTPPTPIGSLAVLPLENLSGDATQDYFADGMTEGLITGLARLSGLQGVKARASVMRYKGAQEGFATIARELNVQAVLTGAVLRSDNQVSISLQLIDAASESLLWADRYDLDLADVVAVQREITDDIAHVVGLDGPGGSPAPPSPPARRVDPEAYDLYLRAQTRLERVNATDADSAVAELERAVSLDPEFADAFGALASAYAQLYGSYEPARASGLEPRLRAAIDTALALDPDSPDALLARGALFWNRAHGWQHEEAIETQRRAVALRPTFSAARRQLSVKYNHVGLAQAALDVLVETEESPAVLFQKGLAYRIQGRLELALASWLAIPEGSRNTNHVGHIAWALIDLGRTDEAARMLRGVPPGTVDVNGMLSAAEALLHATAGEVEQAQASIAAATSRAVDTQESHHATYLVAVAYARLGDNVEALRWLRFTAANGFPCHPLFESDPDLDPLRSYEPFVQFVEESRSRWEGYRTRLGMETSSTAPARPAPPGPAARPS